MLSSRYIISSGTQSDNHDLFLLSLLCICLLVSILLQKYGFYFPMFTIHKIARAPAEVCGKSASRNWHQHSQCVNLANTGRQADQAMYGHEPVFAYCDIKTGLLLILVCLRMCVQGK